MKNILRCAIVFVFITILNVGIFPSFVSADTLVVGDINEDTIWTAENSPYMIFDMMSIDYGATLTIESGAIVKFSSNGGMLVNGSIEVLGTLSEKVYFTSMLDDSLGGDTNMDEDLTMPESGDWRMILFNTGSVAGILNNLNMQYSDGGIVVFDASVVSNGLDLDTELSLFNSKDSSFSNLKTSGVNLFDQSDVSINRATIVNNYDYPLVGIYGGSSMVMDNTEIIYGNNWGDVFDVYDFSNLVLNNSSVSGVGGDSTVMSSSNSSISIDNLIASYVGNILNINNNVSLLIKDSIFSCNNTGVYVLSSSFGLDNVHINCANSGVISNGSNLNISNSKIENATVDAINVCGYLFADTKINDNEIKNSGTGIHSYCELFESHGNSIHGNTIGVSNEANYLGDLIMDSNWWGSKTGPYHNTLNIYGLGDTATDGVSYYPWLPYDPLSGEMSNVLFIPGFQGSRLYKRKTLPIIGEIEDKLWEPNTNSDITDMLMDNFGISLDESIYTRDIVDKKNALFFSGDVIYESFISDLNNLITDHTMAAWSAVPYDWRYDPMYVVEHGSVDINGNIFYENNLFETEDSYIVKKIGELINTSKSGRVTLVAHSNGGLVLKALMLKLEQMKDDGKNDYIDYIDKVIMVATPQIGTPKAVAAILHGYDQELYSGVILKQSVARNFGLRIPGAYSLLPTSKYFYNVADSPVLFDPSLNKINNFYKIFGEKISNYEDFTDFLLAKKKDRTTPAVSDLESPAILFPGIFNDSINIHERLDSYIFPSRTKVYQLAGWGLPTLKAVRYFTRADCIPVYIFSKKCKIQNNLDVEPVFTDDGDETVVTPSANYISGNNYYLNIDKYANDLNIPLNKVADHARILDIPYTRWWIRNILSNNSVLPNYVTNTKPASKQNLVMYIHTTPGMDKNVSVIDKDGNDLGIKLGTSSNPETTDFIPYVQNIPGGFYSRMGNNHYVHLGYSGSDSYRVNITPAESSAGGDMSSGGVIIRQDVVSGDTIDRSVTVPSIPVSNDTIITTDIGAGGSVGSVNVDNEGDGSVDAVIPSVPTENPNSPVQNNDNVNFDIIESVDNTKNYGSSAITVDYNQNHLMISNSSETKINNTNKDILIPQIENKKDQMEKEEVSKSDKISDEIFLISDLSINNKIVASAVGSGIEIPWLKILNTIIIFITISLVLYKFMYRVK